MVTLMKLGGESGYFGGKKWLLRRKKHVTFKVFIRLVREIGSMLQF